MKKKTSKPTKESQAVTAEWLEHFHDILDRRLKELDDVLKQMDEQARSEIDSKNWKTAVRGLDYIQKFTAGLMSSLVDSDEAVIALLMDDPTANSINEFDRVNDEQA